MDLFIPFMAFIAFIAFIAFMDFIRRIAILKKNKNGRVVSKKRSARGMKNKWIIAVTKARKALGVRGFAAVKKGSALYKKAKSFY
jgi:predicted transcriptional regulator